MVNFEEGDEVVLADTHHSHNSELKKNEGRRGVVKGRGRGHNSDRLLVEFEGMTGKVGNRWWVAPKWLEPMGAEQ